jgi:hypothetical protein
MQPAFAAPQSGGSTRNKPQPVMEVAALGRMPTSATHVLHLESYRFDCRPQFLQSNVWTMS